MHLLVPLLLGLLAPPTEPDAERRPRPLIEALLALVLASGLALVASYWLYPFRSGAGRLISSDFHEYCSSTWALRTGAMDYFTHQRSAFVGWPSAMLSEHLGMLDGMALMALLSCAGIALGLYAWGRAVQGPLAGVAAAIAAFTMTPLVVFARTLSYYPEMIAIFTLGAGTTAMGLRFRTPQAVALAGVGAAACYLADYRGLFWGLSFTGLTLVACLAPEDGWRERVKPGLHWLGRSALKLLLVLGAHAASWRLGAWAFPSGRSLEEVMDVRRFLRDQGVEDEIFAQSLPPPAEGYIWGSSDLRELPQTLEYVLAESALVPESYWMRDEIQRSVDLSITPWIETWAVAGGLALLFVLLSGKQRFWRLAALAGCAVPFLAALKGAIQIQRATTQYVATAEPIMALCMGLAFAGLVQGPSGLRWLRPRVEALWTRLPAPTWRSWVRPVLGFLAAGALLLGGIPSHLSPVAEWRPRLPLQSEVLGYVSRRPTVPGDTPPDKQHPREVCSWAIALDEHPSGRLHQPKRR